MKIFKGCAFGPEQVQGELLSPWRYSGKRLDPETGFIYFGERYYDTKTFCWLTPDPLEDIDGPNYYAYVRNNPLYYTDPDGCALAVPAGWILFEWLSISWGGAAAATATTATVSAGVGATAATGASIITLELAATGLAVAGTGVIIGVGVEGICNAVNSEEASEEDKKRKQRNKPPSPDTHAEGNPHSIIERPGSDGQYTTHHGD